MAWPGTLTESEQTSLLAWLRTLVRPVMGELAKVCNHLDAANLEYNGVQLSNLAKLDAGDVVPVESGLDGAEPLTKTQVVNLISYAQTVVGADGNGGVNTPGHRQAYARAAGEQNLIG